MIASAGSERGRSDFVRMNLAAHGYDSGSVERLSRIDRSSLSKRKSQYRTLLRERPLTASSQTSNVGSRPGGRDHV